MLFDRYGNPIFQPEATPPAPEGPQTPLSDPVALHTLYYLLRDHSLVDSVVRAYPTWAALVAATPTDLAYRIGVWATALRVPTDPTLPDDLPEGVECVTRYETSYPQTLLALPDAPVLLYQLGQVPARKAVTIGGSHYPSSAAVEMTRASVAAAVEISAPVVAVLDSGCGHLALQETIKQGGVAVAVASGELGVASSSSLLIRQILEGGGAVVSEWGPGESWTEDRTFRGARIAAALGQGVVLPEVGNYPTGGVYIVRHAIELNRYLVIPRPVSEAETPFSGSGTASLAHPAGFRSEVYGTSPRIQARLRMGYPAADAVVGSAEELKEAIKAVVR